MRPRYVMVDQEKEKKERKERKVMSSSMPNRSLGNPETHKCIQKPNYCGPFSWKLVKHSEIVPKRTNIQNSRSKGKQAEQDNLVKDNGASIPISRVYISVKRQAKG